MKTARSLAKLWVGVLCASALYFSSKAPLALSPPSQPKLETDFDLFAAVSPLAPEPEMLQRWIGELHQPITRIQSVIPDPADELSIMRMPSREHFKYDPHRRLVIFGDLPKDLTIVFQIQGRCNFIVPTCMGDWKIPPDVDPQAVRIYFWTGRRDLPRQTSNPVWIAK